MVARWEDASWVPTYNAPTHADRRGGPYVTYRPDLLTERPLALAADVAELAWRVEDSVRRLGESPGARGLEGLARFLPARRRLPRPGSKDFRCLLNRLAWQSSPRRSP